MAPQENLNKNEELEDYRRDELECGRDLANAPPGEEVVITGLAGMYPDSRNVYEFQYNLYNKVDMVSGDDRRWSLDHPEIPKRAGMLYDIEKFDCGYFGLHYRQAHAIDPVVRLLLEKSIEAIMDAGVNPSDLEGTNTGVFVGACFSETDKTWFLEKLYPQYFAITGVERSMIPNRLSYFLKLNGPSYVADTACSSSLYALEHAYKAIRTGRCEMAIVGGTNLCLHPFVSLQFARLGVLSNDGACKVFDADCDGYARSEAVSAIFLQKSKDAKRIYARVVHTKTNCDGYKEQGITFPSSSAQKQLMQEIYQDCNLDPRSLSYLEAHGTGTKVGDPEEVAAIDAVFCKGRKTSLMIGSVKSNIGHSEPSSGLCSITKVIIGIENGIIPPNMHYSRPREGLDALEKGRVKVVAEKMPFEDDRGLIGINSFGFGGGNCHVLLHWNQKQKSIRNQPSDGLPRLVCVSGRIPESITSLLDDIKKKPLDVEYLALFHNLFRNDVRNHLYRGYSIVGESGEIVRNQSNFLEKKIPLYLVFSDFGDSWATIANQLSAVENFANSMQKIFKLLASKGIDLATLASKNGERFLVNEILGTMAVQVGIVDVLRKLELEPDGFFGYGISELICGYFEGTLSLEETVFSTYELARALDNINNNLTTGVSSFDKIKPQLQKLLHDIISEPKPRGNKWLSSTSTPVASAEHFVNSLNVQLPFKNLHDNLERKSNFLEIGNRQLKVPDQKLNYLRLEAGKKNSFVAFLEILGSLYNCGHNPQIAGLYPKVKFPVSRGTPMISPLIKWDHRKDWFVTHYSTEHSLKSGEKNIRLSTKDDMWKWLNGHVVDGRNLFPATGYLNFVWEVLSLVNGILTSDMNVVFENCRFLRGTPLSPDFMTNITIMIQRGSGNFEVIESGAAVCTGRIFLANNKSKEQITLPLPNDDDDDDEVLMQTKDIYKELRLKGYTYTGDFKKMKECNVSATKATIRWEKNWVTFIDNMFQLKIVETDTRLLYVPTGIERLSINAKKHIAFAKQFGQNPNLTVYNFKDSGLIKCGAIEIRGITATSIPRRKRHVEPVLEKYQFVPNSATLTTNESIRVVIQLILENLPEIKVKVVELIDEATAEDAEILAPIINEALGDIPLIRPEITVLTKQPLKLPNIEVEDEKLVAQTNCNLVVATNALQRVIVFNLALGAIKEKGFVLSREPIDFEPAENSEINILAVHVTKTEKLFLFRRKLEEKPPSSVVEIKNETFDWLPVLQKSIKNGESVTVVAQEEPVSGVLGLVNCLRKEPGGGNVRSFFITGEAPRFDPSNPFYSEQLKKNFAFNVYKNSQWGTYRHCLLNPEPKVESEHCFVNVTQRGDLSSLKWIEGPLSSTSSVIPEEDFVHVYYSSLNFRDIMTATGRISGDVVTTDRTGQECVQGFEFSGRTKNGTRVFGMILSGALSTIVKANKYMYWKLPDYLSLEDGVTMPVVYSTVSYAFFEVLKIKKGNSILIHAGSGGIGIAAIALALHFGLTVYTTVGTKEKREFLKQQFPQLRDHQIGNSRDTSFETMISQQTDGRGVDIVLNSLSEEKLEASIRCVARGGHFLEIGKFDLANNRRLQLFMMEKEAAFHGIMVDDFFTQPTKMAQLQRMTSKTFEYAIPLPRTVFKADEVEKAFRYMAGGKHVGKVVIQVRKEENQKVVPPTIRLMKSIARYNCDPENVYVIAGGLGGFGLELADWLVLRGARKLVLTSRKGVKTGYQAYRIRIWKSYSTTVHVSTANITTRSGCEQLLTEANSFGTVEAIFNLAVVLKDALFDNQTEENFRQSLEPKAFASKHLDEVSRKLCPNLKNFVIFSSVSCGRGNAGQTNYGMANSIIERICEKRKEDGFPALAIQWGAIGDVGLVAEMQELDTEIEIGGTLTQPITSCLEVMDNLLKQENAVVSSIVVAEKRRGGGGSDNIVDAVAHIIGIRDTNTVSQHSTLAELGMDSMSAVEIKQTLEREFDVFLTPQDMRSMTFARLQELQEEKLSETGTGKKKDRPVTGFEMMLRLMGDESEAQIPFIHLKSKIESQTTAPHVIFFPGLEGAPKCFHSLAAYLNVHVDSLQYSNDRTEEAITDMAQHLLTVVEPLVTKSKPFQIVSYSYGVALAMEVVSLLESKGYVGNLVCIDGAPYMLRILLKGYLDVGSEAHFQTGFLCQLLSLHVPIEIIFKNKERILACSTFEDRLVVCEEIVPNDTMYSTQYWKQFATASFNRLKALNRYHPAYNKLKSKVTLFKPEEKSVPNLPDDYRLSENCENPVEIKIFKGNHVTILENIEMAECINELVGVPSMIKKESIRQEETPLIVADGIKQR